jgi:hypothetical protein
MQMPAFLSTWTYYTGIVAVIIGIVYVIRLARNWLHDWRYRRAARRIEEDNRERQEGEKWREWYRTRTNPNAHIQSIQRLKEAEQKYKAESDLLDEAQKRGE